MNCCPGSTDCNAEGREEHVFMIYEVQKRRNIHRPTEQTAQSGNRSVNYYWISSLMNKYASSQSSIKHHVYNVYCFQKLSLRSSMTVSANLLCQGYLGFHDCLAFSTPCLSSRFPLNNHTLSRSLSFLYLVFILKSSVFSFLFLSHILFLYSQQPPSHQSPRTPGRAGGCRWLSEARCVLPARRSGWGGDSSYLQGVKGQSRRSEQTKIAINLKNNEPCMKTLC